MPRLGTRRLILPTALTVTTFAAVAAVISCGGDDQPEKKSAAVIACADAPANACEKCKDDKGNVTCGPSTDCYPTSSGNCTPGSSS